MLPLPAPRPEVPAEPAGARCATRHDPLDEFAPEQTAIRDRAPARPWRRLAIVTGRPRSARSPSRRVRPRTAGVVARLQCRCHGIGATLRPSPIEVGTCSPGVSLFSRRPPWRRRHRPDSVAEPHRSGHADYPGAPPLRTAATAVPSGRRPTELAECRSRPLQSKPSRAAASAFDVRRAVPQVAGRGRVGRRDARRAQMTAARGRAAAAHWPPMALTTLGGTVTRNGRLALVLDVTEQGDVARIVSHEAVDVHSGRDRLRRRPRLAAGATSRPGATASPCRRGFAWWCS